MDGRRASLLAHGHLQHGFDDLLQEIRSGSAWNAGWNRHVRNFRAGHIERESRLWHGMERRWRHHPVDLLDPNRRQKDYRRELGRNGEVSRGHSSGKYRLSLEEKLWHSVRGLACTRGRDPCGFDCHGLLGIRRDAHEPDGSGTWKNS